MEVDDFLEMVNRLASALASPDVGDDRRNGVRYRR